MTTPTHAAVRAMIYNTLLDNGRRRISPSRAGFLADAIMRDLAPVLDAADELRSFANWFEACRRWDAAIAKLTKGAT